MIDATQWFQPLRRNLGKKNCELAEADIGRILDHYLATPEGIKLPSPGGRGVGGEGIPESKWFDNADFGYWKITVERPLRLKSQMSRRTIESLRFASGDKTLRSEIYSRWGDKLYEQFSKLRPEIEAWLKVDDEDTDDESDDDTPAKKSVPEKRRKKLLDPTTWLRDKTLLDLARLAQQEMGDGVFDDHNDFRARFEQAMKRHDRKPSAADKKVIYKAVSWRDPSAPAVIAALHKPGKLKPNPLFGLFSLSPDASPMYGRGEHEAAGPLPSPACGRGAGGEGAVVEYEPDTDLRDTEQVPLKEAGGVEAFFEREVLPHAPDAWIAMDATRIGYEISFARYFYRPAPLRTLDEIRADILALEQQTEGLLNKIVGNTV